MPLVLDSPLHNIFVLSDVELELLRQLLLGLLSATLLVLVDSQNCELAGIGLLRLYLRRRIHFLEAGGLDRML